MVHAYGDDLEDDYVPDSDLVIVSGEEGRGGSDEDEEDYEEFQGIVGDLQSSDVQGDLSSSKKRKRKEKEKEKKAKVRRRYQKWDRLLTADLI